MGRRAAICLLAVLLLPGIAGAGAPGEETSYSLASARATPMPQLAESLLGTELAADVIEVSISQEPLVPIGIAAIQFLHRPVPLGQDFCRQRRDYISFTSIAPFDPGIPADQVVRRSSGAAESALVAMAPNCRTTANQLFMHLNSPVTVEAGMAALRDLAAIQQAAHGDAPLPFRLTCQDDMDRDRKLGDTDCSPTARSTLANLPAGRAGIMNPGMIILLLENKDEWIVRTSSLGTDGAEVALTRRGIIIRH